MLRDRFLIKNIIRGVIWLALFLLIYLIFKRYVKVDFIGWLEPLFAKEKLMFLIFLCSEVIIGIIPPEVFMIWALRFDILSEFLSVVAFLAVMSYLAGVSGYFIGRYLNTTRIYRYLRRRFLKKMDQRLQDYGLYLIIIAALTPVPFSGVAMLVGSVKYPFYKYLIYSATRFIRFGLYAWIFWEAEIYF